MAIGYLGSSSSTYGGIILGLGSDLSVPGEVFRNAADRIFYFGAYPGPFGGPSGEIGQYADTNYIYVDVAQAIGWSDLTGYDQQVDVHQYIGFTDRYFADPQAQTIFNRFATNPAASRVYIVISVDVTNEFSFNDHDAGEAAKRIYPTYDVIGWSQSLLNTPEVEDLYDVLGWTQVIDTADTTFGGSMGQTFLRQHISFRVQGSACPEKEYTPFIGASGDDSYPEVSATAPTLGQGVFTLTHPRVTPTLTLTLKNPEFGNADVLRFTKVDRRTRGGDRKIFSDLGWGSTQSFELTISNICSTTTTIDDIIDFLNTSLGEEIGLLDWENRQWKGIIVAPETEVTPQVGGHSIRIVFEGELV
jgi:hypothetical protein